MERMAEVEGLVVSQKKEWAEVLTGFETANKYTVLDSAGNVLYVAAEEGGGFGTMLGRWILKSMRPFKVSVMTSEGQAVMRAMRPFRFIYHELKVHNEKGELLGTIVRQFSILRRIYTVTGPTGQEVCQLFGPMLHPWTFEIRRGEEKLGEITKKWGGVLTEGFTDADNFGVTLRKEWDVNTKAVFLGAVFLIDFVHFEK